MMCCWHPGLTEEDHAISHKHESANPPQQSAGFCISGTGTHERGAL